MCYMTVDLVLFNFQKTREFYSLSSNVCKKAEWWSLQIYFKTFGKPIRFRKTPSELINDECNGTAYYIRRRFTWVL